ncbi:MAG: SMC-Scp complex subunit ScpB [Clostridiales Family XIII bacterium]|jgi:segregation and condensation protein B|nr:SMC-Scp complex subunit ScpB [Clostridiales Family XIII bacterium]
MTTRNMIKSALESMMFVWGDPLDAGIAANAMNIEKPEALECFRELMREYDEQERGVRVREVNGKYQYVTYDGNYDYIRSIVAPAKERRLTQAALEALAIIAYKQPVTKSEIDSIRGIRSERVIDGLIAKGLVEERGRSNAVGRPILYGTTDLFLTNFDLTTIKELPQIEDIEESIQYVPPMTAMDSRQTRIDFEKLEREEDEPRSDVATPHHDGAAEPFSVVPPDEPSADASRPDAPERDDD